jgi:hypothetical protein
VTCPSLIPVYIAIADIPTDCLIRLTLVGSFLAFLDGLGYMHLYEHLILFMLTLCLSSVHALIPFIDARLRVLPNTRIREHSSPLYFPHLLRWQQSAWPAWLKYEPYDQKDDSCDSSLNVTLPQSYSKPDNQSQHPKYRLLSDQDRSRGKFLVSASPN